MAQFSVAAHAPTGTIGSNVCDSINWPWTEKADEEKPVLCYTGEAIPCYI